MVVVDMNFTKYAEELHVFIQKEKHICIAADMAAFNRGGLKRNSNIRVNLFFNFC